MELRQVIGRLIHQASLVRFTRDATRRGDGGDSAGGQGQCLILHDIRDKSKQVRFERALLPIRPPSEVVLSLELLTPVSGPNHNGGLKHKLRLKYST